MELRHLRYFIAVAEELHFGRAAERLHISQPPLSQQIRQLEEELGASLLVRNSRNVRLTAEGEALLVEAKKILASVDAAKDRVRAVKRGEAGRLCVGFMGYALMTNFPGAIREFSRHCPDVRLELVEETTALQLEAILAERMDIGLISYLGQTLEGLQSFSFQKERFELCMPEGHYLGKLHSVPIEQLDGVPLIMFPRESHPTQYDAILSGFRKAGITPNIVQHALRIETGKALVAAGMGLSIHPSSASRIIRPGIFYRPLDGPIPKPELRVVWREQDNSPTVWRFLDTIRKYRMDWTLEEERGWRTGV